MRISDWSSDVCSSDLTLTAPPWWCATCCGKRTARRKPMPEAEVAKRPMTGSAAAAVLLMLFEDDEAAQILSRLEPDEVRQLGYAMYDVADVDRKSTRLNSSH